MPQDITAIIGVEGRFDVLGKVGRRSGLKLFPAFVRRRSMPSTDAPESAKQTARPSPQLLPRHLKMVDPSIGGIWRPKSCAHYSWLAPFNWPSRPDTPVATPSRAVPQAGDQPRRGQEVWLGEGWDRALDELPYSYRLAATVIFVRVADNPLRSV